MEPSEDAARQEWAQAKPLRKRRRLLIVALLLVLVSGVAWWNWPRRDRSYDFVFEHPPASDIVRPPSRPPAVNPGDRSQDGGWQLWRFDRSRWPEALKIMSDLSLDEQIVLLDGKITGRSFSSAIDGLRARRRGSISVDIMKVDQALLSLDDLESHSPDERSRL